MGKYKIGKKEGENDDLKKNKEKSSHCDVFLENELIKNGDVKGESEDNIFKTSRVIKKFFLNQKSKVNEFLPSKKKYYDEVKNKLGYFKTKFGTVAVGYNKFKKKSDFGFTLLSKNDEVNKSKNVNMRLDDKHNYFSKRFHKSESKMEFGNLCFKFDSKDNRIEKINEKNKEQEEDELLYSKKEEEVEIDSLNKEKRNNSINKSAIDSTLNDFKIIEYEKENDNKEFYSEIKKFISLFNKNKLKKSEDSEDMKRDKERILKIQNKYITFLLLKKRIEEMLKFGYMKKDIEKFLSKFMLNNEEKLKLLKYFSNDHVVS